MTNKRCPNGTRKNRKTGECVKHGTVDDSKRCPKGTRSKECIKHVIDDNAEREVPNKRCPKGTRRNRKTGECDSNKPELILKSATLARSKTRTRSALNDKKILENGVINFFDKKAEYRSLSNFWENDVVIVDKGEMREYESGEHCFHGEKYIRLGKLSDNETRKHKLLEYGKKFIKPCIYKKGAEVKKMGGKNGLALNADELELWNKVSMDVQKEICRYKLDHYEEVRRDLAKSKGKILVHPAMRCSEENLKKKFWEGKGVVVDGKIVILGKNRLGNLWMELRD